ncbi:MAG: hypothetical protein HFH23_13320 [Ruminococcus sp.]|nr:hypothetical protein [Ruminococcus sp.]
MGNFDPYGIKPSGGCALRAYGKWLLTQPRSGAEVRQAGLFVLPRTNKIFRIIAVVLWYTCLKGNNVLVVSNLVKCQEENKKDFLEEG